MNNRIKELLKPCPFCGLTDKLSLDNLGDDGSYCVECDRCKFSQHAIHTRESAIMAWNTRSSVERLPPQGFVERKQRV